MNVSMVSVSRRAGPPQCGQVVRRNASSWFERVVALPGTRRLRQQHRQLLLGHGHDAVDGLAVDDRDRRAPVRAGG